MAENAGCPQYLILFGTPQWSVDAAIWKKAHLIRSAKSLRNFRSESCVTSAA
jgi:hypothetical protein